MKTSSDAVKLFLATTHGFSGFSTPTFRGSTITFQSYEEYAARGQVPRSGYSYGLAGTPTTRSLQSKLSNLHDATDTFLTPSGLSAITTVFLSVCQSDDVVCLPDNVYPPVRRFASRTLRKMGVTTVYYDPSCPETVLKLVDKAKLLWVESPGSTTLEVADMSVMRGHADRIGAYLGCDNSWASPFCCRPLVLGADFVVEAVTKFLSGHSDLLMGSISVSKDAHASEIHEGMKCLGIGVSPDDCFLALRGLETAAIRIEKSAASALSLAQEIEHHPCVAEVLYPALQSSRFHSLWRAQFDRASGLFTVVFNNADVFDDPQLFNRLDHFSLGASWGGTHSVLSPARLDGERSVNREYCDRPLLRVSIGLETYEDLRDDLIHKMLDGVESAGE